MVKVIMDFNPDYLKQLLDQDLGTPVGELQAFRAMALKKSLLKKYVPRGNRADLHIAALSNFIALNTKVKSFVLDPDFLTSSLFIEWKRVINFAYFSGELQAPRVTFAGSLAKGTCGPGSSLGADDNTFFTKMFNSHLTVTSSFLYDEYVRHLPNRWSAAEEIRKRDFSVKIVPGSKMASVPKDANKNRTTCTEPILNMFYQLGIKTEIEAMLLTEFKIDLATQPVLNRRLARHGSIHGTLSTVDLKDASDSISVELARALLPSQMFSILMKVRSRFTHVGTELVELAMLSTMGNGFTFALMTLIFTALIKALYNLRGEVAVNGYNFGVFGDDLIIKSEYSAELYSALDSAGLTVNVEKSYTAGPFRESCGGDYYNGHDVRGIYLKEFTHATHWFSAFNRLHFWSLRHGVPLYRSLKYLLGGAEFRPIPSDLGFDAGHIVTSKELTSPKRGLSGMLQYRAYKNEPLAREKCGERFANFHGGLISFLGGFVRNDRMLLRPKGLRYRVVKGWTPIWDFIRDPAIHLQDMSRSWSVLLNTD